MASAVKHNSAKILIVEDDPLIAGWIEEILVAAGMDIGGLASSAAEALALATESQFSLALVDIGIPGSLDGIELACLLRNNHAIPTIFLTGRGDAETAERARAATPVGFLRKPFRPAQVFNAIERALTPTA